MRKYGWHIAIGLLLVVASAVVYGIQVLIFRKTEDTFFYLLQDLAFVPVQILVVTLIVNELLKRRESGLLRHKLNMVIGSFFSEMGNELLSKLFVCDARCQELRAQLGIDMDWTPAHFAAANRTLGSHQTKIEATPEQLENLRELLQGQRFFLLNMLGNPNLLEHESFTDLLWSICHLTQELEHRQALDCLPVDDYQHLSGDLARVHHRLLSEWLCWVEHLSKQYPYMYSLICRANPLTGEDSAWKGCRLGGWRGDIGT